MTNRQCLTCRNKRGEPISVRYCICTDEPIIIDDPEIVGHIKSLVEAKWNETPIN